ncbi:MAG: hypothetical protein RLZZ84_1193 [Pseudomonadota bacterium]|jgi:hypothetical protein
MTLFRIYLVLTAILIISYTAATVANHGLNLLPVFFGDMAQMSWPGQFNADFFSFLMLGGLWLAWRHHFTLVGIAFGLFIFAGGMPFLASYLLFHSVRARGDIKMLLLGEVRARQR